MRACTIASAAVLIAATLTPRAEAAAGDLTAPFAAVPTVASSVKLTAVKIQIGQGRARLAGVVKSPAKQCRSRKVVLRVGGTVIAKTRSNTDGTFVLFDPMTDGSNPFSNFPFRTGKHQVKATAKTIGKPGRKRLCKVATTTLTVIDRPTTTTMTYSAGTNSFAGLLSSADPVCSGADRRWAMAFLPSLSEPPQFFPETGLFPMDSSGSWTFTPPVAVEPGQYWAFIAPVLLKRPTITGGAARIEQCTYVESWLPSVPGAARTLSRSAIGVGGLER